jgi:PTH1 family peptidyl-tRNA hydrolase
MFVAVGLGNPGKKYEATRHNIGFQVIDRVAAIFGVTRWENKFDAEVARGVYNGQPFMLVKPQTFMNKSGWAVQPLLHYYRVPLERLVVVVDDLDLEVGKVRLRMQGSDGGHRGLRSIIERMGSQGFKRIRVGVGRPRPGESAVGRVLKKSSDSEESKRLVGAVEQAVEATADFIKGGAFENWSTS